MKFIWEIEFTPLDHHKVQMREDGYDPEDPEEVLDWLEDTDMLHWLEECSADRGWKSAE